MGADQHPAGHRAYVHSGSAYSKDVQDKLRQERRNALRQHGQPDSPELRQHHSGRRRAIGSLRNRLSCLHVPARLLCADHYVVGGVIR